MTENNKTNTGQALINIDTDMFVMVNLEEPSGLGEWVFEGENEQSCAFCGEYEQVAPQATAWAKEVGIQYLELVEVR